MPRGKATPFPEFMRQMEGYSPALKAHRRHPHIDDPPTWCQTCLELMQRGGDRARYMGKTLKGGMTAAEKAHRFGDIRYG